MFFMSILPPGPSTSAVRDFGLFYGIPSLLVLPQRRTLCPSLSLSPSPVVSSGSPITGPVGSPTPAQGSFLLRRSVDSSRNAIAGRIPPPTQSSTPVRSAPSRSPSRRRAAISANVPGQRKAPRRLAPSGQTRRSPSLGLPSPITPVRRFLKNKLSYTMSSRRALHRALVVPKKLFIIYFT